MWTLLKSVSQDENDSCGIDINILCHQTNGRLEKGEEKLFKSMKFPFHGSISPIIGMGQSPIESAGLFFHQQSFFVPFSFPYKYDSNGS